MNSSKHTCTKITISVDQNYKLDHNQRSSEYSHNSYIPEILQTCSSLKYLWQIECPCSL